MTVRRPGPSVSSMRYHFLLVTLLTLAACNSPASPEWRLLLIENPSANTATVVVPGYYETTFPRGAHGCTDALMFPANTTVLVITGADTLRRTFQPSAAAHWRLRVYADSLSLAPLTATPC